MQVIKPVRKRKKAQRDTEAAEAAESTEPPAPEPPESAAPEPPEPAETAPRGLLRKSAIRRFLKQHFDFPLQIREAYFASAEARFAEDLRRSVARAREQRRNTLMAPDA